MSCWTLPPEVPCPATHAGEPAVVVKGEFTWDLAAPATLMDLDVSVPAGSFLAIVGPTGTASTTFRSTDIFLCLVGILSQTAVLSICNC